MTYINGNAFIQVVQEGDYAKRRYAKPNPLKQIQEVGHAVKKNTMGLHVELDAQPWLRRRGKNMFQEYSN